MKMSKEELEKLGKTDLVNNLIRSVQLDSKESGNGQNPFDTKQLKEEVLNRMGTFHSELGKFSKNKESENEAGDQHDEFS